MGAHLEDRVALWVSTHPDSTVEEIAQGVLSRQIAVKDVLHGPLFTYSRATGVRRYRLGRPLEPATVGGLSPVAGSSGPASPDPSAPHPRAARKLEGAA